MADLFHKQAKEYADTRPTYPPELFQYIASKTPCHDLVWDVGTGSGQAIKPLSELYATVIGTDTSQNQLQHAPSLPNVRYIQTPASIPLASLPTLISPPSTADLVTVAQALHWFDLPHFYTLVRTILKKPHGVIAVWCYTLPEISETIDEILGRLYKDSKPYWEKEREMVDERYEGVEFPFEGEERVRFVAEKEMDLEGYFGYIRSWSAYGTAKVMGVELLNDEKVEGFRKAWGEEGGKRVLRFPVYLRIGRVGDCNEGLED
ncbi:putative methyltransferase [Drosera capensis]